MGEYLATGLVDGVPLANEAPLFISESDTKSFNLKHHLGRAVMALAIIPGAMFVSKAHPGEGMSNSAITHSEKGLLDNSTSTNWSGYVAGAPSSLNFVQSTFEVPSLTCPATGDYDASVWAGLGGSSSTDILYQDGLGMACNSGTASYRFWWEEYPTNTEQDYPSRPVSAGDKIIAYAMINQYGIKLDMYDFGPASNPSFQWELSHQIDLSGSYTPTIAECIVERPSFSNGTLENLTDFGEIDFLSDSTYTQDKGCDVVANNTDNIITSSSSSLNHLTTGINVYDIVNSSNDVLASTQDQTASGAVTVTWQASS